MQNQLSQKQISATPESHCSQFLFLCHGKAAEFDGVVTVGNKPAIVIDIGMPTEPTIVTQVNKTRHTATDSCINATQRTTRGVSCLGDAIMIVLIKPLGESFVDNK